MEIDLDTTYKKGRYPKKNYKNSSISREQRDERIKKNLYLYYGKAGYRAKGYPSK